MLKTTFSRNEEITLFDACGEDENISQGICFMTGYEELTSYSYFFVMRHIQISCFCQNSGKCQE